MDFRIYKPHPLLCDIVNSIIILQEDFDKEKSLPIGLFPPVPDHSLQFYPRDGIIEHKLNGTLVVHGKSIIVASCTERINLSLGYNYTIIRIGFHPGGLHRLLHLPLHEMVDKAYNSEEFFNADIKEVNEQLGIAKDFDEMKIVVELFLLKQLKKVKQLENFERAMFELMKRGGNVSIDYLAKESCLCFRQFERKCKERIGISPKLFARITRFSNAYRMYERQPQLSWTGIAYLSGYFDQMHFIHDFKEFANVTPTTIGEELSRTPVRLQTLIHP